MHMFNSFVTLTYDDDHLPEYNSLNYKHFQDFMKRLRKSHNGVRFYMCGEYGEDFSRPHYHALLFNCFFPDRKKHSIGDSGSVIYTSEALTKLWPYGFSTIGDVTFESAAYVARYITKKITGEKADDHYKGKLPEYTTMSRGGNVKGSRGLGSSWFKDYKLDVFPSDQVVLRGKVMKPPRAYDKWLEQDDVGQYTTIKLDRKAKALENAADNTAARLKAKEQCKLAQFALLKRGMENEA